MKPDLSRQYARVSRLLGQDTKLKAVKVASVVFHTSLHWQPQSIRQLVVGSLGRVFTSATAQELDVLAFYVFTRVMVAGPDEAVAQRDRFRDKKDSINEMNRMDMLFLQQMMAKKSQLESMISQVMKSASQASDTAVQNLKAS